jgi:hypothetical protein
MKNYWLRLIKQMAKRGGLSAPMKAIRLQAAIRASNSKWSKLLTRRFWPSILAGVPSAPAVWAREGFLPELLKLSRKHFRQNIFTPFNIMQEMVLAGGTLSYEGIDVLRRVETNGLVQFHGSMIPSKSETKRMAGMVEWFARPLCLFILTRTTKGESVQLDIAKTMLCILQEFHLDEIGKMEIVINCFVN